MADYIDKNILCQAYLHVEWQGSDDEDAKEKLKAALNGFAKKRAEFFLYTDIDVSIEFKEGSLIAYLTVLGYVTPILATVAAYPKFRDGAIAMFDDAKRLAEFLISESLFETKSKGEDIVRLEARTGVVGSIRKILSEFDAIKSANGVRSQKWMAERLDALADDVDKLLENLHSEDDQKFVRFGFAQEAAALPKTPSPASDGRSSAEHVNAYVATRRELWATLKQEPTS